MAGTIIRWILNSTAFKIVCGFCIAAAIVSIVAKILQLFFVVIRQRLIRVWICIGACAVSAGICFRYSKWSLLPLLFAVALSLFASSKEKNLSVKADGIKFAFKDNFHIQSQEIWSWLCVFAIWEPVMASLNVIVCGYYDMEVMEWFRFYWTFEHGIFQYKMVRYAIALMPWILLLMPYAQIDELKEKDCLVDLAEEREKKENEKRRILNLNPDAGIRVENNEETDAILNDISKFL